MQVSGFGFLDGNDDFLCLTNYFEYEKFKFYHCII